MPLEQFFPFLLSLQKVQTARSVDQPDFSLKTMFERVYAQGEDLVLKAEHGQGRKIRLGKGAPPEGVEIQPERALALPSIKSNRWQDDLSMLKLKAPCHHRSWLNTS